MFGNNKILKPQNHDGDFLDVVEIFPTIQGEGPLVGVPAIFIRLGGCNLACDFCDTEFDEYKNLSLEEIIREVKTFSQKLVVITGGEPLRQPIEKLCDELINLGYDVQIETNGTIFREINSKVTIICSPKVSNNSYHNIRPDLLPKISAFKFIISANKKEYSQVPQIGQKTYNTPVYLQPMDEYNKEKNKNNCDLTIKLCQENNYILSLQMHKILGLK